METITLWQLEMVVNRESPNGCGGIMMLLLCAFFDGRKKILHLGGAGGLETVLCLMRVATLAQVVH